MRLALAVVLVLSGMRAEAFSLLGPYASWMQPNLGYVTDIGGPMDIDEGYRWNVPTITYAFEQSFVDYFGSNGVAAVDGAMAILNNLPPASSIVLSNYPLSSLQLNGVASARGLWDLKSFTLNFLLHYLGLAAPSDGMFCLRTYDPAFFTSYPDDRSWPPWAIPNYILERNFDPGDLTPTVYINGDAYSAWIAWNGVTAFMVTGNSDPGGVYYAAVADLVSGGQTHALYGGFFSGLSRDDVAGLQYLLSACNINYENLLPDVHQTDQISTNAINGAWRQGIEKITFYRHPWIVFPPGMPDFFPAVTNDFTGGYLTNGIIRHQHLERIISQPDILFCASDLGAQYPYTPVWDNTGTGQWANNASLNWDDLARDGPGVIQPPIRITLQKTWLAVATTDSNPVASGPSFWATDPAWGSFDGTTNPPVTYPAADSVGLAALTLRLRLKLNNVLLGSYTWQLPVLRGGRAAMEASTNLVDWVSFGTVTNTGVVIEWQHSATNYIQRFFRAVPQ